MEERIQRRHLFIVSNRHIAAKSESGFRLPVYSQYRHHREEVIFSSPLKKKNTLFETMLSRTKTDAFVPFFPLVGRR